MARLYDDEYLPRKYRALMEIGKQPFLGELPVTCLFFVHVTSHRLWVVGTAAECQVAIAELRNSVSKLWDNPPPFKRSRCYCDE